VPSFDKKDTLRDLQEFKKKLGLSLLPLDLWHYERRGYKEVSSVLGL
jgi:hypothetical protein